MTCKHCGKAIRRYYGGYTKGWTHEGGDPWCRSTMADPKPTGSNRKHVMDADMLRERIAEAVHRAECGCADGPDGLNWKMADEVITDLGLKGIIDECCGTMQIEGWVSDTEVEK